MNDTRNAYGDQHQLWNGSSGRAWVAAQDVLDRMFQPFEDALVEVVATGSGYRVLDVGCGTGSTTLAIAQRLGAAGRCIGIDISAPMITAAQARAATEGSTAAFIRADAQRHAFEPASFDTIVSRFGVMFFDDPVYAFTRLRNAASNGAKLHLFAWRSAAENAFMTTAECAAAPLLPELPVRRPGAPGQRVQAILNESGWSEIDVRAADVVCTFPEQDLIQYLGRLGPVGLMLQQTDERTRMQVIETVRTAFEPYVYGNELRFTAACWEIVARA